MDNVSLQCSFIHFELEFILRLFLQLTALSLSSISLERVLSICILISLFINNAQLKPSMKTLIVSLVFTGEWSQVAMNLPSPAVYPPRLNLPLRFIIFSAASSILVSTILFHAQVWPRERGRTGSKINDGAHISRHTRSSLVATSVETNWKQSCFFSSAIKTNPNISYKSFLWCFKVQLSHSHQ